MTKLGLSAPERQYGADAPPGPCFSLAHTPEGLRDMAQRVAAPGEDPDPAISELARLLEVALREAAEKVQAKHDATKAEERPRG